jgi:hypothetical protein
MIINIGKVYMKVPLYSMMLSSISYILRMNSDFETPKQNIYSIREISLPDGSKYIQLRVLNTEPLNLNELQSLIQSIILEYSDLELRLIFESKYIALDFISNINLQDYEMIYGKNAFFTINLDEYDRILEKLAPSARGFKLEDLDPTNLPDDYIELLINSFAYDFESRSINIVKAEGIRATLRTYCEDSSTSAFAVRRKDGMILGAFTMIETDDEVQFHSAAGRPKNELKDLPHKLWVIDYFAIRLAQFLEKPMRFSSSGAIHLYNEMGISQDDRFGVLIRKKKK